MMDPHLSNPEIYAAYRGLVKEYAPRMGLVLKTDLYNETRGGYQTLDGAGLSAERTVYIEIDRGLCLAAKAAGPLRMIVQGDIRALPFPDGLFQSVIDLSTLDHVLPEQMPLVVHGYRRVLRRGGRLLLVVWCKDGPDPGPRPWKPDQQYHMFWPDLEQVSRSFEGASLGLLHSERDRYLAVMVGKKGG